jgi:penicillin-binding protein 1C
MSDRRRLIVASIAFAVLVTVIAVIEWPAGVPEFSAVKADYTPSDAYLLDRHGVVLDSERISFKARRLDWVPLADVSPALVQAIVDGEDRRYFEHHGVDWQGVLGALRDQTVRNQRRGASTISMQLASLLRPRPRGEGVDAWTRKLSQVRLAAGLEKHWSKTQILEAYLNLLGYRGELQGIGAASQRLAGKTPSSLTLSESVVIAALLPQPSANVERVVARACSRAKERNVAVNCDTIRETATTLLARANEPARDRLAPQVAHALLKSPGQRLVTTLDASVQRGARDILRAHLAALSARNVRDGAIIAVDNATGEVIAYVGSGGPNSSAEFVDGVRAPRQAGSTLKPFLYELALERRYLTAASLLDDSPIALDTASGTYIPQDYDHDYKGLVSVRTALAGSLNVPAVRTLVLVGVETFRDRLHDLGYTGITHDGDYYGYSLALGSAEVSLWEQAQAYRALARGGVWSPIRLTHQPSVSPAKPLLPSDATFVVADIMSDRGARAITFGLDNHLNTGFWSAAKTGTSKDMRDNWCIGFSRQFTVAVWVGNFEGDSMHDVSGVTGAAPVWQDVMAMLQQDRESKAPSPPAGVMQTTVRFSPAVEPARREWFIAGAPASEIIASSAQQAIARIDSPANGMIIALDPDIPANRQRIAIAARGARSGMKLRVNDEALGTASAQHLWTPKPGAHYVTLEDDQGNVVDRILFTVRG